MAWLKLTDAMLGHRKTRRLLRRGKAGSGLAAFGLHVAALLHCSEYLTDGFIESEFVDEVLDDANVSGRQRAMLVAHLVDGGPWEPVDGGWQVHDYLEHTPQRDEVLARRAKDAERKAKGRARLSGRTDDGHNVDGGGSDDGVRGPSDRPVPSRPVPSQDPPAPAAAGEWAGPPPIKPDSGRQRDLATFDSQLAEYGTWLLPDIAAAGRSDLVRAALSFACRSGTPSHDQVRQVAHQLNSGSKADAA
jgi:hypothetical protein